MSDTEIKVVYTELLKSESELSELLINMSDRSVNLTFTKAKGSVPERMVEVANELNEIGVTLENLIEKTKKYIIATRVMFQTTDQTLSSK
jgi:hypothetical protein